MTKNIIIGFLLIALIGTFGYFIYIINFQIFTAPEEIIIKEECDYDGLRKITMEELGGNATTNKSIQILASGCDPYGNSYNERLFIASESFIKPSDVNFEWKSFDTLTIKYNSKLEVFEKKHFSDSIKPKIIIEYLKN